MNQKINGLTIVALVLITLGVFTVLTDHSEPTLTYAAAGFPSPALPVNPTRTPFQPVPTLHPVDYVPDIQPILTGGDPQLPDPQIEEVIDEDPPDRPEDIRLPYDSYVLTQATHGAAYGDAAIDLAGGNGADILAPINGQVILNGYDFYGNTILIIENEVWQVKLLHGDFYPQEGQWVGIGKLVGNESNHGYTVDSLGNSCRGRRCGYHTHMNVVDKRTGSNANLIKLLQP